MHPTQHHLEIRRLYVGNQNPTTITASRGVIDDNDHIPTTRRLQDNEPRHNTSESSRGVLDNDNQMNDRRLPANMTMGI
jgi:hypothetical protein